MLIGLLDRATKACVVYNVPGGAKHGNFIITSQICNTDAIGKALTGTTITVFGNIFNPLFSSLRLKKS